MPARKKPKSGAKSATAKSRQARWTAVRLMKFAPDAPSRESTQELLARIKSTLTVPNTPTRKSRRS
jgi:hypothetical protein